MRRTLALALTLGLVVGCKRPPARPEEAPRAVPTEVGKTADPTRQQLIDAVCGARKPCDVLSLKPAGQAPDEPAVKLWVAELTTEPAAANDAEAPKNPEGCVPFEHWLVRSRGPLIAERRELLRVCNNGYGAAGIGEDEIAVAPNQFTHVQRGGSAWRWENSHVLDLSPLRLHREASWTGSTVSAVAERSTFDWADFRGRVRWYKPECPPGGGPPPPAEDELGIVTNDSDTRAYVYDPIPLVTIAEPFRAGAWKTIPLGSCAPPFDGVGSRGFITHGAAGDPRDAAMRVVASANAAKGTTELFIEVVDDVFTGPTAKWLYDDHIELWLKDEDPDPSDLCLPGSAGGGAGRLRQWAIGLADGKLYAGHHATADSITVDRATGKDETGRASVRLRVTLAVPALDAITVVYSDGDDGKTQERLIATSKLTFAKGQTLGHLRPIATEEAVCEVVAGVLVRKLTRPFPAHQPVLE